MTCIVGVEGDGYAVIGGDSAQLSGWGLELAENGKVFRNGQYVIGASGDCRLDTLMRFAELPKAALPHNGPDRFMMTTFVDAVRTALKDGGFAEIENAKERFANVILVATFGRLYELNASFAMRRTAHGYYAIGAGWESALGALYATPDLEPKARARLALEASEAHNAAVRQPFTFLESRVGE